MALALAAAAGGGGYWYLNRGLVTTDDAQVDAQLVAVPAQTAGTIAKIHFEENQVIHEGDLLVELDDSIAKARVEQADASVQAAKASAEAADADVLVATINTKGNRSVAKAALTTASAGAMTATDQIKEAEASVKAGTISLKQAETDRERASTLSDAGAISKAEADRAETAYQLASSNLEAARARVTTLKLSAAQAQGRVAEASAKAEQTDDVETLLAQATARAKTARAQVTTAEAALAVAKIDLAHTKVYAPASGVLSKKTIAVGQFVGTGQPVAQLVPSDVWVTANFKETQLASLRVGQEADFTVDAYGSETFHGTIESFSGATGSRFALLPPDNASGNFTKVVQRLPVRVHITDNVSEAHPLRPGMSVELTVHTR
ncbi:MAG: HlyD family secretion protein [Polyangiaceae bacterium]|nr:HlyD family secretion protein [Polyangiaceae bacterium]